MPMKWTTENDHLLLLKILECSPGLTIDGKKIAAAWPTDRGEVPTPRAITEHVISIRKKMGVIGGGTGANSQDDGTGKPKATPRKRIPKDPNTTPKKRAPRKPKTVIKSEGEDSEVIEDVKEDINDEDDDFNESPTKRLKLSDDDEENYAGSHDSN